MAEELKLNTDNFIYFYHLDKFCILPVSPDTITDTMAVTFNETTALARTAPVFSYYKSGPRSIAVSLSMHRDLLNEVNTNISNLKSNVVSIKDEDYVDTLVNYLQAAALPKYKSYGSGSSAVVPPMVAVRFGTGIFIKGVINSSIQVSYGKPIMSDGKYAKVQITFTVYEVEPYDADAVASEGSFRGITSTFKDGVFKSNSKAIVTNNKSYSTYDIPLVVRNEINKAKKVKVYEH